MKIGSAGRARGQVYSFLESLRFLLNVSMILIIPYFRKICYWKFWAYTLWKRGWIYGNPKCTVLCLIFWSCLPIHCPFAGWSYLPIWFKREIVTLWLRISTKRTVTSVVNKFFSNPFSCFHQFCMVSALKSNFSLKRIFEDSMYFLSLLSDFKV